jgi:hypothetical protein
VSRARCLPRGGGFALAGLALLLLPACGGDPDAGGPLAGTYVLDRVDYVEREVKRATPARGPAQDLAALRREAGERARAQAAAMDVQLTLATDGTYRVRYRFGKERGADRGTWTRRGETLLLHTAAGGGTGSAPPAIRAVHGPDGIRFSDWPVPGPFLLRPQ